MSSLEMQLLARAWKWARTEGGWSAVTSGYLNIDDNSLSLDYWDEDVCEISVLHNGFMREFDVRTVAEALTILGAIGVIPDEFTPAAQKIEALNRELDELRAAQDAVLRGVRMAYAVPFDPGTGPVPGYVAGQCGHRIALTEWLAGFLVCERCPSSGEEG